MGIALVRLPDYELNLIIYTGRIDASDGVRFYGGLDADDPAAGARWLTYIDEDADFSGIPVTAYPQTKNVMIPKLKQLAARPGYCSAVVCSTAHCELITSFWRSYVEHDPDYVSHPVVFNNLKDACDWLHLPDAGCGAAAEAVRAQHLPPAQALRPERAESGPRPEA